MSKARDRQYLVNIFHTLIFQGGSYLARFIIVPLSLGYLDATRYGLWLVISSIFMSMGSLDFGLGNGLRNKLSESLTLNNLDLAKRYISTTYFLITTISFSLLSLFFISHQFINWGGLFNAPEEMFSEFNQAFILCVAFYFTNFVFNLIINILTADQKIGISRIYDLLSSILVLISIYILNQYAHSSFLYLCLAMIIPQLIVLLSMNIYLFSTMYRKIRPSITYVQFSLTKDLLGLGSKFFVIGLATMIVHTTDNIIITTLLGPSEVTPYNIAFQYMAISIVLFSFVLAPSWSAYTDAHTLDDSDWIKRTLFRLIKIWLLLLLAIIVMVFISQPIYRLWIGEKVTIPGSLTVLMALYAAQITFNGIFSHYILGVGKIDLLLRIAVITGTLNIPLSVFFAGTLEMGAEGVILATITCGSIGFILAPIQTYLLTQKKAKGIWNR